MTLLVYALACLLFSAAFVRLRLVRAAGLELDRLAGALAVIRDAGLSDDEKEALVRAAALSAVGGALRLVARIAATGAVALVPVLAADAAGVVPAGDMLGFAVRLDVAAATTLAALALVAFVSGRLRERARA